MNDRTPADLAPLPAIRELHVWIGHFAGDGEGMLTINVPIPDREGVRQISLLAPTRLTALGMGDFAKQVQRASNGQMVRLELRTFHPLLPGVH